MVDNVVVVDVAVQARIHPRTFGMIESTTRVVRRRVDTLPGILPFAFEDTPSEKDTLLHMLTNNGCSFCEISCRGRAYMDIDICSHMSQSS